MQENIHAIDGINKAIPFKNCYRLLHRRKNDGIMFSDDSNNKRQFVRHRSFDSTGLRCVNTDVAHLSWVNKIGDDVNNPLYIVCSFKEVDYKRKLLNTGHRRTGAIL